jgi:hypothetical protein
LIQSKKANYSIGKAPRSNLQAPENFQISKLQERLEMLAGIEVWSFSGAWSLEFGAFQPLGEQTILP